jgi:hypothetical protein
MTPAGMKAAIEAAIAATGTPVSESAANQLLALCTGIIKEITTNAEVQPGIPTAAGPTTGPGKIL